MSEPRFSGWQVVGLLMSVVGLLGLALTGGVFLGFQWGRMSGLAVGLGSPGRAAPDWGPALPQAPFLGRLPGQATAGPYLGVRFEPVTPELVEAENLGVDQGALIRFVEPGSPAEAGGVLAGDIIEKVNGVAVDETHSLRALIQNRIAGEQVSLTALRDGKTVEVSVTLGEGSGVPGMEFLGPDGQASPGFHFEFRCSPEPCPFVPFPPAVPDQPSS